MAKSLKQYTKCLQQQQNSNFSLKKLLGDAKDAAFSFVTSLIPEIDIVGAFNNAVQSAKDAYETEKNALIGLFDSSINQIESAIDSVTGLAVVKCALNDPDPEKPTIDVANEADSAPASNDSETVDSAKEVKNSKDIADAKTESIDKVAEVVTDQIRNDAPTSGILEIRETVRRYKKYHPLVDTRTKSLPYFQPVSDYIGSSVLAYTPDKSSLLLDNWSTGLPIIEGWKPNENPTEKAPNFFRRTLANKLDDDTIEIGQTAYENLNKQFVTNLSRQLKDETVGVGIAHSAYIVGDYGFCKTNIPDVLKKVEKIILDALGETAIMSDYLFPIDTQIKVNNDVFSVEVEGQRVNIDKRGNIIVSPQTQVNNTVFDPKRQV